MPRDPAGTPFDALKAESRVGLAWLLLFSFCINLLVLTSPIYMMQTYDRVLASGHHETLLFMTLIAGVAVLVMGLLEMVRSRILGRVGGWLEQRLAPELISAGMRGALRGLAPNAQSLRDLASVRGFIGGSGVNAALDSPWTPIFITVIWLMHPLLGIIALGAALILLLAALIGEAVARRPVQAAQKLAISNVHKADSALRNAEVFHAMGMLPGFLRTWVGQNDNAIGLQRQAGDRHAALTGFSKFFRLFVQILILGAGAYLVLQQELTPGGMIAASILLGRALAPVDQAIGAWKAFIAARDAWGRLNRLLTALPSLPATLPLPAPTGALACEQLVFQQPGADRPVLAGISFALAPGEVLGVLGPSAAGKSTLCRLLLGTWQPTRGHVRLDGADVFRWPAEQLGPFVGYLPQDVELLTGSVTDNIARLDPEPDPDAVVAAAVSAGVHDLILRLPQGYETQIGEGGSVLSGGQRQRIGLARALYRQPRLLVLDEPNANLDTDGETALQRAILNAKGWGATVILVTHAPRVLAPADKLLVLQDGQVRLFGPREEVLAKLSPPTAAAPPRPRMVVQQSLQPASAGFGGPLSAAMPGSPPR
ncbi:MAG: type I secretion system permease/ATPase [Rhodospirillales bacterium]|nr:MAG: type I secretion system permease/ATPase [Rhodospirillales bacterium]